MAVILIHVVISPPNIFTSDRFTWWLLLIIKSSCNWAVPIFFMISGALLLRKEEPIRDVFKKRIGKILIPFIFWTLIYIYFDMRAFKDHTFLGDLVSSVSGKMGLVTYHLWFIYALIGLYVITPLLRILVKNARRVDIEYFLILSLIVNTVMPIFERLTHIHIGIPLFFAQGYVLFFMLGYYLNTFNLDPIYKKISFILAIISIAISDWGTYIDSSRIGANDYFFIGHFLLTMIFPSIALFLYFKDFKFTEKSWVSKLKNQINIARVCFGIYFAHAAVLGILEGGSLGFQLNKHITLGSIVLTTLLTFTICFVAFYILEKLQKFKAIKYLSRLVY